MSCKFDTIPQMHCTKGRTTRNYELRHRSLNLESVYYEYTLSVYRPSHVTPSVYVRMGWKFDTIPQMDCTIERTIHNYELSLQTLNLESVYSSR